VTIQGACQCIGDDQALDAFAQQFLHQQHEAGGDKQGDHEIDGQRLDVDVRSRVIEVPTPQWRPQQQRAQAHALEQQGHQHRHADDPCSPMTAQWPSPTARTTPICRQTGPLRT
jgi:hypothetical protein